MALIYNNNKNEPCINLCKGDCVHVLSTDNDEIITIYNKGGKLVIISSKKILDSNKNTSK